jgi:hypothetical protein
MLPGHMVSHSRWQQSLAAYSRFFASATIICFLSGFGVQVHSINLESQFNSWEAVVWGLEHKVCWKVIRYISFKSYKVKLYLHVIKAYVGALGRSEWSVSHPTCCTPEELPRDTHSTGGWLNARDGLDTFEKRRISCLCWELDCHSLVHPARNLDNTLTALSWLWLF